MQSPELPTVDLGYRPTSYFWPLALQTHLLARIKGAERRTALMQLIDDNRLEELPAILSSSALTSGDRATWGRIHPDYMGGEYLPNLMPIEVIIARITIASTTQDVTCVYARRCKHRIHYRVVDEYGGDSLSGHDTRTSNLPLTLGALESFFNRAWSIFKVLERNFGDQGYDLEQMLDFVAFDSEFYPDLDRLYRTRIEDWAACRRLAEQEAEQ